MTDKNWFCDSIRKNEGAMYGLAYSILRNSADSEEAVCEAIYRGYSRLDTLENKRAFKTWILTIVHNVAVEMVRKSSKYQVLNQEDPIETAPKGVDIDTKIALKDVVEGLPQPYRTVIILYYYEGLSAIQIAEITGALPTAVRQQLSRGRKMLKERLKEDFQ